MKYEISFIDGLNITKIGIQYLKENFITKKVVNLVKKEKIL
ncbi:YjcQ family protein [Clostridium botulinum]|nr:YjcQ family protein [Clostridium botulinum]MCD3203424.1 hypothetical protein [Clostridium botulinum C/D]MCD3222287.1 hypothetical protein [Clostridium botulinum C/D]MCD3231442.1 hypothetical protein [Clostridium botulinum C/D]MCD3273060.1 hypothetical protein [Clostridium botulinum C/D]